MTEDAVKVCVRVRPLVEREERATSEDAEAVQLFWKADQKSIHPIDDGTSNKSFSFDRVFAAEETTSQLYQTIAKPLVVSAVEGYNGTIFAYGQTSSGKTFTMMGCDRVPGVIPLAVEDVFQTIKSFPKKEFLLRVSYMEIYNETVTDLLVDSWKRKPLEVRETINKNIYVADLTEELVTSPAQALAWIRRGEKNRHYGKTKMNQRSSRSHTIFRMILESREKSDPASGENADGAIIVSHLNLVDLAGSERASQTGAEGARFKEGCNINRSLFILGQVIKKLTEESQKGFINYRDSKLTRILQNSLGGNAKTLIICTITPAALEETLGTLQFASTAKKMKNDPHVTEVSDDGALLKRYRNEIVDLKRRLLEVSSVTQTTATEKEVLSQLLQEKDQLQREQQDRIRNLTKLLVTGSNPVPVHKVPKRRVTWGGKMLSLARPSACDDDMSDDSLVEPFSLKRKANNSCLMEHAGDEEYFGSHWVIPEEPSDDMEMSQNSETVRSFGDSSRDFLSPEKMCELSQKVSNLELQLEMESQQKEEAMKTVETLDGKVVELQLKLQTEAQEKLETVERLESRIADLERRQEEPSETQLIANLERQQEELSETQRIADLERQLEEPWETQRIADLERRQEEPSETQRIADLERQLEEQSHNETQRIADLERQLEEQSRSETQRIADLERQLEEQSHSETQRIADLERQLEEQSHSETQRIADLERQLEEQSHSETQRIADLERQLEEQSHNETQQIRKEFAETIQLCETLASEKEMVAAERDYVKQELGMFIEQTQTLEQEKAALFQELKERRDLDEFKSLEEEFRKEHESELHNEISDLKKALESSELRCRDLQNKLEKLSEELKEKNDLVEELQRMSGKDLVQEVAKLRRSLDDAEGISRDTKKEWAVLRSQHIGLEEMSAVVTADLEKARAETTRLLSQLDLEKSRYKKMEIDLQKELNVAFDENTKLTSLLDGKVPQNLIDSVELERTVASLNHQLKASQEAEETLRARLEELASLQTLPDTVDGLTKQVCELTEKLHAVSSQRDALLLAQDEVRTLGDSLQTSQDEVRTLGDSLQTAQDEVRTLRDSLQTAQDEVRTLRDSLQTAQDEVLTLQDSLQTSQDEVPTLRDSLQTSQEEVRTLQDSLQTAQEEVRTLRDSLQTAQEEVRTLRDSLQMAQDEVRTLRDSLQMPQEEVRTLRDFPQTPQEEVRTHGDSLQTAQDEVRTLQDSLQTAQDEVRTLQAELTASCQREEDLRRQFADASQQLDSLRSDLQRSDAERSRTDLEAAELNAVLERLQQELQEQKRQNSDLGKRLDQKEAEAEALASLTAERDQLKLDLQENVELMIENQEELRKALDNNREQNKSIKLLKAARSSPLDDPDISSQLEALKANVKTLTEELERVGAERDEAAGGHAPSSSSEMQALLCSVASLSEDRKQLQEKLQSLEQEKLQLRAELDQTVETLQTEVKAVTERLRLAERQRDALLSESDAGPRVSVGGLEGRVAALSAEKDQLQEILEGLRQEKKQLREEFEEQIEMLTLTRPTPTGPASGLQEENLAPLQLEIAELQDSLLVVTEQKNQLEADLQLSRDTAMQTENVLRAVQEQLHQQSQRYADGERISQEDRAQLQQQLAETKRRLESLQEELQDQKQTASDRAELHAQRESDWEQQMKTLTEALEGVRAESHALMLERDAARLSCSEVEALRCRATSLAEERDELQQNLQNLREEMEGRLDALQAELRSAQEHLRTDEEKLQEQMIRNADLETLRGSLNEQMRDLAEKLAAVEAEQSALLSEKETAAQTHSDELQKLHGSVAALAKEKDQLLEMLEELRREKDRLGAELEDGMLKVETLAEKLLCMQTERDQLLTKETNSTAEVAALGEERERLLEALQGLEQEKHRLGAQLEETVRLNEAGAAPEASGQSSSETLRLQDSAAQLQESLGKFRQFVNHCRGFKPHPAGALREKWSWMQTMSSYPQPTVEAYGAVCKLGMQTVQTLTRAAEQLPLQVVGYRMIFEELVKKDSAIFEERRLQDLLLSRVQPPSGSVNEIHSLWKTRTNELLDKRQLYLQQMESVLEKLGSSMASFVGELRAEVSERETFQKQLLAAVSKQPVSFSLVDLILHRELERRSAGAESKAMLLQAIDEQRGPLEQLKQLEAQAEHQLREERSKSATLLQAVDGVPLKTEVSLLQDNQHLGLQLQEAQENIRALHGQKKKLEEAQASADNRVSNHKRATQLLQTELQDSRALIQQKEAAIQTLRSSLQESEKKASPGAAEMEKVKNQLFKMEMKLSAASDEHEQEKRRMTSLLKEKEESLRKLKETLRRSQQQGEESILQGKDIHARLTKPRGLMTESSILLEKTKLEEEVKRLQLQLTELESLVSSQQAEISKWKNRAVTLKIKSKAELDKPASPRTPTKRGLATTADHLLSSPKKFLLTPKKMLDSPKKVLESPVKLLNSPKLSQLGSPKSRFFDLGGSSEVLSRTCPTRFFDNSSLGIVPDAGAEQREEWWPRSPKPDDMCKNQ